jgi:hypothetical protein
MIIIIIDHLIEIEPGLKTKENQTQEDKKK